MELQENNIDNRYNRKRRLLKIIIIVIIGIALFCAGCYCGKASCGNGVERKTKIEKTDGNNRVSQTIKYEDGLVVGGCDCGKDTKAGDIDYNVPDEVI